MWIALTALVPNATTVEAIQAARRGQLVALGTPAEALAELNRDGEDDWFPATESEEMNDPS